MAKRTAALETSNAAIRRRADQLEAINTLVASTAAAMDVPTLIQTALEQAIRIMQTDMGVLRVNGHITRIGVDEGMGAGIREITRSSPGADQELRKQAIADWEAVSASSLLYPLVSIMKQFQVRASISLPILANGKFAGEIILASHQPRDWTAEETALLEIIAHHLGTAAERTQSVTNIRKHNELMQELIEQSERLNGTFTINEVITRIGEGALSLSKADRLVVFIRNAAGEPECVWSSGLSADFVKSATEYVRKQRTMLHPVILDNHPSPFLFSDIDEQQETFPRWPIQASDPFHAVSAWPLIYESRVTAFVGCFYNEPQKWNRDEQEILGTFFRLATAVLENTRLYEAEHAQRKLAEALRDVTATLASTLDRDEVLDGILSCLERVVPHHTAVIFLIEENLLKPIRWRGVSEISADVARSWTYPVNELRNRQVMIETVQASVIPDTEQDPSWVKRNGFEWARSYAGAPIVQRGEVTGFIDVMSEQPDFYNAETGVILQAFANQAAISLENARLYSNTQQRMAETSALYRAIQPLFNPVEDIEALARRITESVTNEFSSAHCSILLLNEKRTHLNLIAQAGYLQLSAPELPLDGPGLTVTAVRTGNLTYSPDVNQEPNYVPGAEMSRSELAIPLYAGGQVIGVLNLESPEVNAFDQRGQRLLASFAEQVALGLENSRLFATIRENARQMARLHEVAQRRAQEAETMRQATSTISSSLDLKTVLGHILDSLGQVVPHDSATMFVIEDAERIRVWATLHLPLMEESHYYPRNNGLFKEIEEKMQPVVLDDAQSDARFCAWGHTSSIRSWMGVPLIVGNELMGFLTVDRKEYMPFKPEEAELGLAFANQAAIAVQNARLYESAQRRARELEALHTATTSLVSTLDLQTLLERILVAAISAIPTTRAAALHLVDETGQMHLRVQHGLGEQEAQSPEWNASNSLWAWVLQERRPALVSNSNRIPPAAGGNGLPGNWAADSLLIAPLVQEDQILGLITLISSEKHAFAEEDLHLLISFASTATAAIHNAQLHSAVQNLAITDPLTGIYNRRGFFNLARHMLDQAQRYKRPLSAVMIDIDYFKNVNDQFGHDAGDVVLQTLTQRCRKVLRESDLICRYGGEEFTILLSETDLSGAQAAANRLHKSITETPFETAAGAVRVTVSVGVATCSEECNNLERLLKHADQALYMAKDLGRNQVQVWGLEISA